MERTQINLVAKGIKKLAFLLIVAASFAACKKEKEVSKTIVGNWEGKWGNANQAPTNFLKFEFGSNGEMNRINEQGEAIASGTYSANGVQFECTYTHTAAHGGQTHKIGGLYTDFEGKIVGTWGYSPSNANGGTIELNKQ